MAAQSHSEQFLVLTPIGRDAAIAASLLREAGLQAQAVADLDQLVLALDSGAGGVIVTEEAVAGDDCHALAVWLDRQPPWSDLPITILTHHGGGPERNPPAARLARALGNVTFVERPFHPTTLVSVVSTALRARRRQYEARAHLEEVREGEARLRVALKAGGLGSWVLELATAELTCSDRCRAIFGRAAGESLTYEELRQSVHPDDRATMQGSIARAIAKGGDYESEYRIVWPDGSVHWVEVRARVIRDAFGAATRLIGVSMDVTERKQIEEILISRVAERTAELQASERRFRAVFDSAFQLAILTDLNGRVVLANRTALDAIGCDLPDIAGSPIWESQWWAGTPDEAGRLSSEFPRAVDGEFVRYEADLAWTNGAARVFDFSLKPVLDDAGAVVQIIAEGRDVTELKKTEATLRQSQKLEAIGQLTGGLAHDFNNLLMAITANLDLLGRHVGGDAKLQRLAEAAMEGAQRGAALTQRLLAFARRQDLQPQAVHVPTLVEGMRNLLQQSIGPMVEVSVKGDVAVRPVAVDPNQLELAILNLALNARDSMPEGGTITIGFDEIETGASPFHGLAPGAYLRLSVGDTGFGMDDATLKQAIEPFFSTKGVGKGTGLGLSMIHGLAVQSGGALHLASQVGVGTAATLFLPLTTAPMRSSEAPMAIAPQTKPAVVLVVDDDALIAMSTTAMLEDLGHLVIESNSGASALQTLERSPEVDILLTDYAMPGMTGIELARRARVLRPGLPILLLTGYAELPTGVEIDLPRLTKPYRQAQLAAEVAKVLASHT